MSDPGELGLCAQGPAEHALIVRAPADVCVFALTGWHAGICVGLRVCFSQRCRRQCGTWVIFIEASRRVIAQGDGRSLFG